MNHRGRRAVAAALVVWGVGCGAVFPRYSTLTRTPPAGLVEGGALASPPDDVRRLTFLSAALPPSRPDGRTWDEDGHPDLYVVLYRNDEELFRTSVAADTLRPTWSNATVTVRVPAGARMRVELRDQDRVVDETVARAEFSPLGGGADGTSQLLRMENGATMQIEASAPPPALGMGVTYEVHETFLRVLEVMPASPGATAGLRPGDRITAVDGRNVSDLGEVGSRQAMDRSALRDVHLTVQRDGGATFAVDVRLGAVYPAR